MGFTRRTLVADCEISTGKLTVSQLPPIFVGEAGALDVNITLKLNGQAYSPTGVTASMHLYWPGTTLQSEYVQMTVNGNVVSGRFTNLLTALPGSPLLIIRIKEASTNDIIVATATPIRIWQTRGESIVNPTPGPKSSIKSVDGQEPDETGNIVLYDSHIPSDVITGQDTVALALAYLNTYKANAADVYTKLEVYNKTEIETLISTLFRYKGNKATYAEIEAITTKAIGDVWFCLADSSEYAWDGSKWEKLGPIIDLSAYLTQFSIAGLTIDADHTTITAAQLRTALDIYTKSEVDTALATKADKTIEINGHDLSANFDISAHEITADGIGDKTVAGNPLVVEDAIEATAKKVVVGLEPIQDLHGYDSPWPGGGGKNIAKFADEILNNDRIQSGITFHALSENQVRISGTATGYAYMTYGQTYAQLVDEKHFYKAGTYTLSSNLPHIANCSVYMTGFEADGTSISGYIADSVYEGHSVSFTRETDFYANIQIIIIPGTDFTTPVDAWVQIESGSTATTYAPYSNICPISGRTGCNVQRTGKNLANIKSDNAVSSQYINISSDEGYLTFTSTNKYGRAGYAVTGLKVGQRYTFSVKVAKTVTSGIHTAIYLNNQVQWGFAYGGFGIGTSVRAEELYSTTFVATTDVFFVGFYVSAGEGFPDTITVKEAQLELGSSATEYEPYQGSTYSITFPQSAGTVYGGELTINQDGSGELVVDHMMLTFSGILDDIVFKTTSYIHPNDATIDNDFCLRVASNYRHSTGVPLGAKYTDAIASYLKAETFSDISNRTKIGYTPQGNWDECFIFYIPGMRSKQDYLDYFASNPIQFTFPMLTPITYTLTATQVQLLEAYNCLFTDGNSLSLTYLGSEASNVQDEIDEFERVTNNILASIAPVETSTASASHAIGSYIMLNNQFCKVTTAIAAGETIAIGRNVTKTTLAQELLAIINS